MVGGTLGVALLCALATLLVWAAIEDLRHREIADGKNIAIALLAPLWWWAAGLSPWPDMAVQLGLGIGVFALFALAFRLGMMGGGDVKMLGAIALWFPPGVLASMIVVMSLAGGVITLAMLAWRQLRRRRHPNPDPIEVPYGVAIAFAGLFILREPILNQFM